MDLRSLIRNERFTETDRVLALPRVQSIGQDALDYAETLRLPGATWHLKIPQAEALYTIHRFGGAVLAMSVGSGKTAVAWLAGRAAGARTVVVLMRKSDERSWAIEIAKYKSQFDPGDCKIHVVPYSQLSNPNFSKILLDIGPDLIVADEAQNLLGESARARRFWSYMRANPATTFVAMSGTIIKDSVANAAGLSELALGVRSPLPHTDTVHLETWQQVLDPRGMATTDQRAWFHSRVVVPMGVDANEMTALDSARLAAGRRFVQSQGVVFSAEASTDVPLTLERVHVPAPQALVDLMAQVRETKMTPDGEDLIATDMQLAVTLRMIATGFYNRWAWEQVPGGRDEEWLSLRGAWNRSLWGELSKNHRTGYDSEKLVTDQILQEALADESLVNRSTLHFNLWRWLEVAHRPAPPSVPVWVDTYLVDYVLDKYRDEPVIFWYDHKAMEQEFTRRGVPVYGQGTFLEGPARQVAASIRVHGTGRNLQEWNHGVVMETMTDGLAWEQLLGRMHRQGQERPVKYDLLVPHPVVAKALAAAVENAKFIQSMQMTPQKLLTATWM